MKKIKLFYIIASIVIIALSILSIVTAKKDIANQIVELEKLSKIFPSTFVDRMISELQKGGVKLTIFSSSLCIFIAIIVLYISFRKNIEDKRGFLIALFVFSWIFATKTIITLLSITGFVISVCIKKKEKEKKEIPVIEKKKYSKKQIVLSTIILCIYFFDMFLAGILPENKIIYITLLIIHYVGLLLFIIILLFNEIKTDLKELKNNFSAYIRFLLPKLGIMYIVFFIVSIISSVLSNGGMSVNQETLEMLPMYLVAPAAIIYAPFVEEGIFRGILSRIIKNKKVFIVISGLLFGLLHVISEASILNGLVLMMPYVILGGFFAYIYSKTDNIILNILCHMFHNTLAVFIMLLIA